MPRKKATKKKATKKEVTEKDTPKIKYMKSMVGRTVQVPNHIVIHAMMERVEGMHAVDFLKSVGLSVHAMITPEGIIIRCRDDDEGAYHAGNFNVDSLGVEFLVPGEGDITHLHRTTAEAYVNPEQYKAGVYLIKQWLKKHKIEKVSTHRYLSPGRKFDPGSGFPIKQFAKDIGVKINDIG